MLSVPSLDPEFGGPALKARALARALRAAGHDVTLVGAGKDLVNDALVLTPVARFHGTPIPAALHRVAAAVRAAQVVHIMGYRDPVGTVAALAALAAGVPYLIEPVGMLRRRLRSVALKALFDTVIGRHLVGRARLVVATSTLEADELVEDGVPRNRVAVRPNGVDLDELRPLPPRGAFRRELGVPDDAPLVLALGRLSKKKGLPLLVEAVAPVPQAHLAVVGPDDGDGTLEAVVAAGERTGLAARLHLVPRGRWGRGRAQAFADSDVFCLFSMSENFGTAAAEAVACGVVPVVSDQCGAAEWLAGGVVVVSLARPDQLVETLRRLCGDSHERRGLVDAGRRAVESLAWDVVARHQSALYESVL